MKAALYLAVCLACCILGTESLSCHPVGQGCTPEDVAELQCPVGTVANQCGNCECARALGEECGGPWDMLGQCASGLTCRRNDDHFQSSGNCV
ncbi:venom protein 302-like [Penaeus chinensis]|uniref:venom protein 302-like n=1 Tax=Penaeus chinensis TaxID=139456 RepID=UPI001FB65F61|nr:venom protein 302-like [Penaeus chinensis]